MDRKRRLKGWDLVIEGLVFLGLVWYAYLGLHRTSWAFTIAATALLMSGILAGITCIATADDRRRLDKRSENLLVAVAGFLLAACGVWLSLSHEMDLFVRETVGSGVLYSMLKTIVVVGIFYFGWQAWVKFRQAFHRSSGD